ncbi:MAG: hypothetical protein PW791_12300 [Neorhizobium sp.]|jgi:hypothetical protein|nr:hypothetical protein [Neorhizobium sp.]
MILSLNLSLTAIAVLGAGKGSRLSPPPGFVLLCEPDGRVLTEGGTGALVERKTSTPQ